MFLWSALTANKLAADPEEETHLSGETLAQISSSRTSRWQTNISEHAACACPARRTGTKLGPQQGGNKQGLTLREVSVTRVETEQMVLTLVRKRQTPPPQDACFSHFTLMLQSFEPLESTCTAKHAKHPFTARIRCLGPHETPLPQSSKGQVTEESQDNKS